MGYLLLYKILTKVEEAQSISSQNHTITDDSLILILRRKKIQEKSQTNE